MSTFKERLAGHLNDQGRRYDHRPPILTEHNIRDIRVWWDEGCDHDNEDYGMSFTLPSIRITAETADGERSVDPTWFLTEVARAMLRSDQ